MRQRALLAQALVGNPDILILDEPTVGLDPKERVNFRELVSRVAKAKTVIIATHIVSDLEKLASEIIFLNHGKIVKSGTLQELYENYDGEGEPSVEKIYMGLGMASRYLITENGMRASQIPESICRQTADMTIVTSNWHLFQSMHLPRVLP